MGQGFIDWLCLVVSSPVALPIQKVGASMQEQDFEVWRSELLIWIKRRELGWRKRALSEYPQEAIVRCLSKASAYEDVWRQILFPGKSVQDGTLTAAEYDAAVEEWTRKAEL